jgi:transcription initiation factor TFIIB
MTNDDDSSDQLMAESPPTAMRQQNRQELTRSDEQSVDEETAHCPDCDVALVHDEGRAELVCPECGMVVEADMVDHGPEWRAFTTDEEHSRRRVGAPATQTLHDKGLSTKIGWRDADAHGNSLSSEKRQQMMRLRTWDERFRAQSARDRNLKQALGEIERMASALGLPANVRETASVIYRRAVEEDLLPGRSIEAMATASLYAAARQASTPRSLDEFAPVSRVDRKEFARAYRYLAQELGLGIEPADPENYLPRFISDLEVSEQIQRRARELLRAAKSQGVHSGKNPVGLAAGAIYASTLLTSGRLTQREIADVANVSEVTIRNRYRELLEAGEREQATATA